jgi:prepilin-type processing-associated H-X9-DG protein
VPAETIAIVDENNDPDPPEWPDYEGDLVVTVNDTLFTNIDRTANRHSGKANVVYLDGPTGQVAGFSRFNSAHWPNGEWMFMPRRWN